jgi:DNA-binding GntR family transcriptional regulator
LTNWLTNWLRSDQLAELDQLARYQDQLAEFNQLAYFLLYDVAGVDFYFLFYSTARAQLTTHAVCSLAVLVGCP